MSLAHPDGAPVTPLLGGRVRLFQPARGYRAAIDPVLLAAAVPAGAGEVAVELGCGTGAAALCLAARVPGLRVIGLEAQPEYADRARDGAAASGLDDRVSVLTGDLRAPPTELVPGRADHVLLNPPYLPSGQGSVPPDPGKAAAHIEGAADLSAWLAAARRLLKRRGWLTLIHRADRIDRALSALAGGFGAVEVIPLWPRAGMAARRIILRARRDARSPATLHPGLTLHRADSDRFTPEAEAILRDAAPLCPPPGRRSAGGRRERGGAETATDPFEGPIGSSPGLMK